MPKIFALRHQLAEQQAKLKQQAKVGVEPNEAENSAGEDSPSPGTSSSQAAEDMPLDLGMPKQQQQQIDQEQGKKRLFKTC